MCDAADQVLGFVEALLRDDDHIEGEPDASKGIADGHASRSRVDYPSFHNQQIYVAVASHLTEGRGSEEENALRAANLQDATYDLTDRGTAQSSQWS